MPKLETYTGFNPEKTAEYFHRRHWPIGFLSVSKVELVKVDKGAALECGDGRFDQLEDRRAHGVRVFGGINAIMALLTGGDYVGLQRATELIKVKYDLRPGTHSADHGGCGYADLWMDNQLRSARYPYKLSGIVDQNSAGRWLRKEMRKLGGRHFRLNGNHEEQGVRLNPFNGYTENATDGSRFRVDDWFMAGLGIPDEVRFFKIAESVEKLKPDAAKLEIIVP